MSPEQLRGEAVDFRPTCTRSRSSSTSCSRALAVPGETPVATIVRQLQRHRTSTPSACRPRCGPCSSARSARGRQTATRRPPRCAGRSRRRGSRRRRRRPRPSRRPQGWARSRAKGARSGARPLLRISSRKSRSRRSPCTSSARAVPRRGRRPAPACGRSPPPASPPRRRRCGRLRSAVRGRRARPPRRPRPSALVAAPPPARRLARRPTTRACTTRTRWT